MDTTVKTQTLYQAYCGRCTLSGAVAAGTAADEPAITGSDYVVDDVELLDHYLQHTEQDHVELVRNQTEVGEIALANSVSVQSVSQEDLDTQRNKIKYLRKEVDALKAEKAEFETTHASLVQEYDEFKEKCKQLNDDILTANQREIEIQKKHQDEVEGLNAELERLGKENERLKRMVENLRSKLDKMVRLQEEERKVAKLEREKQEEYRKKMDEKFYIQENHNRKMDAQNQEILNLLKGMTIGSNIGQNKTTIGKKTALKQSWKR